MGAFRFEILLYEQSHSEWWSTRGPSELYPQIGQFFKISSITVLCIHLKSDALTSKHQHQRIFALLTAYQQIRWHLLMAVADVQLLCHICFALAHWWACDIPASLCKATCNRHYGLAMSTELALWGYPHWKITMGHDITVCLFLNWR